MRHRTTRHLLPVLGLLLAAAPARAQLPAPNAAGVSSGHVHFMVKDPSAHQKLWVDLFGAQMVSSGSLELVKMPGVFLVFAAGERGAGSEGSVLDHVAFRVRDLAATSARLKAAGIPLTRDDSLEIVASFPDQLKIEFYPAPNISAPIELFHVHFYTPDVDGLRAWYAKHFGAAAPTPTNANAMGVPGMSFSFRKTDAAQAPTKGRSLDHIGFEVRDLAAFCKRLEADGIMFEGSCRHEAGSGLMTAFLIDPAGTRIELTEGLARR